MNVYNVRVTYLDGSSFLMTAGDAQPAPAARFYGARAVHEAVRSFRQNVRNAHLQFSIEQVSGSDDVDERERVAAQLDDLAWRVRRECSLQVHLHLVGDVLTLTHAARVLYKTAKQLRDDAVDVAVAVAMAEAGDMTLQRYIAKRRQAMPDTRSTAWGGR